MFVWLWTFFAKPDWLCEVTKLEKDQIWVVWAFEKWSVGPPAERGTVSDLLAGNSIVTVSRALALPGASLTRPSVQITHPQLKLCVFFCVWRFKQFFFSLLIFSFCSTVSVSLSFFDFFFFFLLWLLLYLTVVYQAVSGPCYLVQW